MLLHDVPYHIQQLVGSPTVLFTPIYMSMGACISLGEFSLCRPRQCGRSLQFVRHITHHREINCQLERWCESAASCAFNGFSTRDNLHFEVKSLLESAPSALTGNGDSVNRTTRENRCMPLGNAVYSTSFVYRPLSASWCVRRVYGSEGEIDASCLNCCATWHHLRNVWRHDIAV